MKRALFIFGVLSMFGLMAPTSTLQAQSQSSAPEQVYENALHNLKFRSIGPAIMMGRIDDIAVVNGHPNVIYIGAATGGVWKTRDGGMTWKPLFDDEPNPSIGALAVAPSNPSIVWVGTGEANNRQTSSWGDGVYKSTDGGNTWTHVGLDDTQAIGRIAIDPRDSNVVYVAAVGHLWGPNDERGLFKTTDGGKTWKKVLFIDDNTGVTDVAIDPQSPNIVYAAAYERRRTVWGFDGGGPGSGIYKTTDGGTTWEKLTTGLPANGNVGRIGLSIYQKNPDVVYAVVENAKGGVFRSDDQGKAWKRMGKTNPRPSYFSQIRVDPSNDLRIWLGGVDLDYSEDGGKTFTTERVQAVHSDFHAIWIDPDDSNYVIAGCDGGVYVSRDGGKDWDHLNVIPLGQIYAIGYDNRKPYHICAGFQDNGEWCGPSQTLFTDGIRNSDWFMTGDSDGFYVKPDPADPETVYTEAQDGSLHRIDLRTNESRDITPVPLKTAAPRYRFNWDSPLAISRYHSNVIYLGGNYLFKSADRGDDWTKLGGDLTTGADRNKLPILGKLPSETTLSLDDGVDSWPTISAIAESPVTADVLWVGTDDGNLQVSRDGGQRWTNVVANVAGVPKGTYVSSILASKYAAGTAYVAFDGHRSNDFHVYLYKTTDYGRTWQSIRNGLPASAGTIQVIREHPSDPSLLFVGAEFGAYFSLDGGQHWNRLEMGLPTVPVDDIQVQPRENDLIVGTYGRSIYILDDLTPIEQLGSVLGDSLHLFPMRPATEWRMDHRIWFPGQQIFAGTNPPYGALIDFYLKSKPAKGEKLNISVLDSSGKAVWNTDDVKARPGVNRINWDLRYNPPVKLTKEQIELQRIYGVFGGGVPGPLVEPGTYTVKIDLGSQSQTEPVKVQQDPRIEITPAALAARQAAVMRLYRLLQNAHTGAMKIAGLKKSIDTALASWKQKGAPKIPGAILSQAETLSKKVNDLQGKFMLARPAGGFAAYILHRPPPPLPTEIGQLMYDLDSYSAAPSTTQNARIAELTKETDAALRSLDAIVSIDLARLNQALNKAGVPRITAIPIKPETSPMF